MAEKRVKLRSSDGKIFEVDEAVAFESQALKNMFEDTGKDAVIPLPNVSRKTLAKVIKYCKYHVDHKSTEDKPAIWFSKYWPYTEIEAWDADFVKVDQATLFNLIEAANYLNIKSLLDLTCQTVADMIKGKKPEEILKKFKLKTLEL